MSTDSHQAVVGGATLTWAGATDVGRVRTLNEDSLLIEPPMFVVADGMGGHEAGEVASALTVSCLRALGDQDPITTEAVAAELRNINSLLIDAADDPDATMGTTGVGLVMVANGGMHSWLVFNVGDSRAYCLEDGELRQISRDHSYVQELIDAGELDHDDRGRHPHRNVVTRALGADEELHADYWIRPLRPGERFLLCSDGLTGEVGDDDLAAILASGDPAGPTVATLVDRAVAAGGRDNVTAVVVDVVSVAGWDDVTTGERPGAGVADEVDADTLDRTLPHGPPPAPGPPPPVVDRPTGEEGDLIDWVPPVAPSEGSGPGAASPVPEGEAPIAHVPGLPEADAPPPAADEGPAPSLIGSMPAHLTRPGAGTPSPGPTAAPLDPPPAADDHRPEEADDGT